MRLKCLRSRVQSPFRVRRGARRQSSYRVTLKSKKRKSLCNWSAPLSALCCVTDSLARCPVANLRYSAGTLPRWPADDRAPVARPSEPARPRAGRTSTAHRRVAVPRGGAVSSEWCAGLWETAPSSWQEASATRIGEPFSERAIRVGVSGPSRRADGGSAARRIVTSAT